MVPSCHLDITCASGNILLSPRASYYQLSYSLVPQTFLILATWGRKVSSNPLPFFSTLIWWVFNDIPIILYSEKNLKRDNNHLETVNQYNHALIFFPSVGNWKIHLLKFLPLFKNAVSNEILPDRKCSSKTWHGCKTHRHTCDIHFIALCILQAEH